MTRSFVPFAGTGSPSVFQRQGRQIQTRRRKPRTLAIQSLEPRLALAVGVGGDVARAAAPQADTTPPEILSVKAPKAGVYGEGRPLAFRVKFTEPVIATGIPTLPITIGETVRQAVWNGKGSGSRSLVFTTVVQAGDVAPTGVQVAGPIALPEGATIRDKAGNDLTPAVSAVFPKARVDAVGPSMTEFGPTATIARKQVSLQVTFSEPVTVRGKPRIPFMLDGVSKQLVYARGSGRNVLTFRYKATKQETPTVDNVAFPERAISLGSSRIIDRFRNAAMSLAAPTDVDMWFAGVVENAPAGAVVGELFTADADGDRDRHTYTLVSGPSDADNAAFSISGNQLRLMGSLDFETKSSYSLLVRSTDHGGMYAETGFTLLFDNTNEVPTDIALSATSIVENAGANAVVGTLSTADPDAGNTFTYALVSGTGSTDNAAFNISGNQLRATASLDFETTNSYSIRVRAFDQGGLFTEKQFTITVTDVAVEMAFVTVGDIGNSADPATGNLYGAVDYQYQIGTYEVTIGQYTAFLNAVAADDPYGLYNTNMATDLAIAGISRAGSPGSYTYSVIAPAGVTPAGADSAADRPITYVSWWDAARFANWMHNGQGSGSTETGAYTLVSGQTSGTAPAKNPGAQFYIPTENEWYKAAYYSPVKGGAGSPGYYVYATQSDAAPGNTIGDGANQANYYTGDLTVTQSSSYSSSQNYNTNVGAFTNSASYYGTYDQSGNVYELNDLTGAAGSSRGLRGGGWNYYAFSVSSSDWFTAGSSYEGYDIGFRLASPG